MIYFVQPKGSQFVKIGYARHVGQRVYHLQIANPDELILLGVIAGGLAKEAVIHGRFDHLRIRGEWFRYTREVQLFIQREATQYQPEVHDPQAEDGASRDKWDAALARAEPIGQQAGKRIWVWVQSFPDRANLVLQWHDPDSGKRRSQSAGTSNPDRAEARRADLEASLNQNGLRNSSRNSAHQDTPPSEKGDGATPFPETTNPFSAD